MGFAEIFFIFIFILIGLINVIARIIASKRRKEKEAQVQGAVQQEKPSQKQTYRAEQQIKIPPPPLKEVEMQDTENAVTAYREKDEILTSILERSDLTPTMGLKEKEEAQKTEHIPLHPAEALPVTELKEVHVPEDITSIKDVKVTNLDESTLPTLEVASQDQILSGSQLSTRDSEKQPLKKAESTWKKINTLTYLKRAVLLSEILGKPKGLE
jgi:Na+-transporting methylmalonyl-CoA/oxaloacetate decarboxylase gamma subunit